MVKKTDTVLQHSSSPIHSLHIGHIIETELRRQGKTVKWLSEQIPCDRRNIYDIFNRENIDTRLLWRLSEVLHVDFFIFYSRAINLDPQTLS